MTTDASWPRTGTWPGARTFDRVTAIVQMQASTTPAQVTRLDYDPETRTTTPSLETHHTPAPTGSFTGPTLGRDEAWFIYTILWKPYACTIDEATAAPIPADLLARVRADLAERATLPWFDARAYWCCVAGLLSRVELARFVGDARIFVHSYQDGGTSIITGHGDRRRFIEAFYQLIVPVLDASTWALIARELGAVGPGVVSGASVELASQRLRLAAATGLFDQEILAMLDVAAGAGVEVFDVLHALRDATHLATHAPRLASRLLGEDVLAKWIDRFGGTQPAWIIDSLNAAPTKKVAAPLVATLASLLPDVELAPIMEAIRGCKAKPEVEKWLARHAGGSGKRVAKKRAT